MSKNKVNKKYVNPFLGKINNYIGDENNQNLEDKTKMLENHTFKKIKKNKLSFPLKCFTVKKKKLVFKKYGTKEKFNLFIDEQLGINQYDDKVKIYDCEADYDINT